jgi:hypothetical protein
MIDRLRKKSATLIQSMDTLISAYSPMRFLPADSLIPRYIDLAMYNAKAHASEKKPVRCLMLSWLD